MVVNNPPADVGCRLPKYEPIKPYPFLVRLAVIVGSGVLCWWLLWQGTLWIGRVIERVIA